MPSEELAGVDIPDTRQSEVRTTPVNIPDTRQSEERTIPDFRSEVAAPKKNIELMIAEDTKDVPEGATARQSDETEGESSEDDDEDDEFDDDDDRPEGISANARPVGVKGPIVKRPKHAMEATGLEGINMPDLTMPSQAWQDFSNAVLTWHAKQKTGNTTDRLFPKSVDAFQVSAALRSLQGALLISFGSASIEILNDQLKVDQHNTPVKLSKGITYMFQDSNWSLATSQKILSSIRKILVYAGVKSERAKQIKIWSKRGCDPKLGRAFSNLATTDPVRITVESWVNLIKENTDNEADSSIRSMLQFFVKGILPAFGMRVEQLGDVSMSAIVEEKLNMDLVRNLCGSRTTCTTRARWFQFFLTHIAGTTFVLKEKQLKEFKRLKRKRLDVLHRGEDGTDLHRISRDDLDAIHAQAIKRKPHELQFMLLLTTGLRIGGLARIKLAGIADMEGTQYKIRATGRTTEKGGGQHTFRIHSSIRKMMDKWIRYGRPASPSEYLFPGKNGGHISTSALRKTFYQWCEDAGLKAKGTGVKGTEYHPHALRHSVAQILKDLGNDIIFIQRFLGHASPATTQAFYTKENAVDAALRANIPWGEEEEKKTAREIFDQVMPECLKAIVNKFSTAKTVKKRKREHQATLVEDTIRVADQAKSPFRILDAPKKKYIR